MPKKVMAHFSPQAWVRDHAIEIDPEGPQEWDATEFFHTIDADYRAELVTAMADEDSIALDHADHFKHDPAAPEWVRLHRGPFDIHLRWEETDALFRDD